MYFSNTIASVRLKATIYQISTFTLQERFLYPYAQHFFAAQLIAHGVWQKPDLVITTHLNFTVAAYWLKQLTGIPYITVAHGVEAWNINQSSTSKKLYSTPIKILAVSNYTRERLLQEQNLAPSQVSLLYNTFDSDRFTIQPKPDYLLERYGLKTRPTCNSYG